MKKRVKKAIYNHVGPELCDKIEAIIDASSMREAGHNLENFGKALLATKDKLRIEHGLEAYFHAVLNESVISRDFGDPDNIGFRICPKDKMVATYLSIHAAPLIDNEAYVKRLISFGGELQQSFTKPAKCYVTEKTVQSCLKYYQSRFLLPIRLFPHQKSIFLLIPERYKNVNAEAKYYYYSEANLTLPHFIIYARTNLMYLPIIASSPEGLVTECLADAMLVRALVPTGKISDTGDNIAIPKELADIIGSDRFDDARNALIKAMLFHSPYVTWSLLSEASRNYEAFTKNFQVLDYVLYKLPPIGKLGGVRKLKKEEV